MIFSGPLRLARYSSPARQEDACRRAAGGAGRSGESGTERARRRVTRGGRPTILRRIEYPHEFSGGQRQRIAIARALITRPKLVHAPTTRAGVGARRLGSGAGAEPHERFQRKAGVTFLHLAVVAHICDTTAVMYRGRIVRIGPTEELFGAPAHPYTRELVDATPSSRSADARGAGGRSAERH